MLSFSNHKLFGKVDKSRTISFFCISFPSHILVTNSLTDKLTIILQKWIYEVIVNKPMELGTFIIAYLADDFDIDNEWTLWRL